MLVFTSFYIIYKVSAKRTAQTFVLRLKDALAEALHHYGAGSVACD